MLNSLLRVISGRGSVKSPEPVTLIGQLYFRIDGGCVLTLDI